MEMIFDGVSMLKHDWRAWIVMGAVALKALFSLYLYFRCPFACGRKELSEQEIAEARAWRFTPPTSFLFLMMLGMGLAIGGLYLLDDARLGALALGLLVLGVFIFLSEPNRLTVRTAMNEVIATTGGPGDSNLLARDNLRSAHRSRALIEIGIVAAVAALLFLT